MSDTQNLANKRTHADISSTASQASIETQIHDTDSAEFKCPKIKKENQKKKIKSTSTIDKNSIDEALSPSKDKLEEPNWMLNYLKVF